MQERNKGSNLTELLLLLSHFSRVWLCAAHQAPPSLGFSRQEHWSGLPFPSPMREGGKWKWSHSVMSLPLPILKIPEWISNALGKKTLAKPGRPCISSPSPVSPQTPLPLHAQLSKWLLLQSLYLCHHSAWKSFLSHKNSGKQREP